MVESWHIVVLQEFPEWGLAPHPIRWFQALLTQQPRLWSMSKVGHEEILCQGAYLGLVRPVIDLEPLSPSYPVCCSRIGINGHEIKLCDRCLLSREVHFLHLPMCPAPSAMKARAGGMCWRGIPSI